jgi:hypothetical protein
MFTIDTLVDQAARTTKQTFAHIPNQEIRTGFESLLDAQVQYTKAVFATGTELVKTVVDSATSYMPKQTVAKK